MGGFHCRTRLKTNFIDQQFLKPALQGTPTHIKIFHVLVGAITGNYESIRGYSRVKADRHKQVEGNESYLSELEIYPKHHEHCIRPENWRASWLSAYPVLLGLACLLRKVKYSINYEWTQAGFMK